MNVREPKFLIDFLFGRPSDAPLAGKQAIFVELPAAVNGDCAERDIVRFGAGEVEKCRTVALLRDCAHIDLQSGAQDDGRAGTALCKYLDDILVGHELIANSCSMRRGHDQVQITDSLATPAIGAGDHHAATTPEKSNQRFSLCLGDRKLEALLHRRLL